jgi:predicted RNA-binding protein with PUA-like domain
MTDMNWLFKEEPSHYSFDALVKDKMKALGDAYPDPQDKSGKASVVDVAPVKKLPRPVTLAEIKADAAFKDFALVRISRLSVMPVSDAEWNRIEKMSAL